MGGSSRCSCPRVIGVYGLVRYTLAMRSREVGIRFALGADAARRRKPVRSTEPNCVARLLL